MPTAHKKVLYVEHDAIYSQFALELFRQLEPALDVFHVSNGAMAWSLLSKGYRPDVIVSDLKMPKMDGHTLLAKVKGTGELQDIPFVLLSDNPCPEELSKEHHCPAEQNLAKPYSTQQFLSFMEKIKSACEQAPHGFSSAAPVTV